MKRLSSMLVLLALAGTALATASASTDARQTVCHRTASKAKPYVKVVTRAKLAPADIAPVPSGGCPKTVLTPAAGGTGFQIYLTGEAESPAGDPVGTGVATVRLRKGQGQACFTIATTNLPAAIAAHIHTGAAGVAGAVVVPLGTPNATGKSIGCLPAARPVVASILKSPASFYVNVHTDEFAGGAIRGQLTGTSQSAFGWSVALTLAGTSEPNAKGTAVVRLRKDASMTCYRLHAENVTLPTVAAHIHRGASTVNGPVIIPFSAPGTTGNSDGCVATTGALIDEITANPAGFYVNVHTVEHPAGAIRAQLG
jgi:hypothetical protein